MPKEYFTMSTEKIAAVVACDPRFTEEKVREWCLADWPEGEEHQVWLDNAPAAEIANWILSGTDNGASL